MTDRQPLRRLGDRVKRADLSIAKSPSSLDFGDDRRGNRHARGYGTEWDKRRARILKRDAYVCRCDECKATGRILPATHVDHITAKAHGGDDSDANLRAMNEDCHQRKTSRQDARGGGRG